MKKLISLFKKKAPEWAFLRVEKQRNGRFPETGMVSFAGLPAEVARYSGFYLQYE